MDMRRRNQGAEPAEIEAVYRARVADFRRVATAIIGDPERGSDAVQDAFGTALRRRRTFRGEAPLEAWLWRLVVNQARDERRAARRAPGPSARLQPTRGNGSGPSDDARLAMAIAALPERQRLAVFLRYYADLEYRQIGEVLGIATGTVSAALNAAHHTLARQLNEVEQ